VKNQPTPVVLLIMGVVDSVLKHKLSAPQWHFVIDFSMGEIGICSIVNDQFRKLDDSISF